MRNSFLLIAVISLAGSAGAEPVGDAEEGEALYRQCAACHQVGDGAVNRVGPHLNRVFDRTAGALEEFRYSRGFTLAGEEGLVWTDETLDAFLANPRELVPNTRMSFRGVKDAQERADLIAYLRVFSDDPQTVAANDGYNVAPEILSIAGDPAYGEYLSSECTACHQASGAASGIPSITQWPTEDFVTAMHAYKDGARDNQVMQMMAGRLSNDEIAALAAYFQSVE